MKWLTLALALGFAAAVQPAMAAPVVRVTVHAWSVDSNGTASEVAYAGGMIGEDGPRERLVIDAGEGDCTTSPRGSSSGRLDPAAPERAERRGLEDLRHRWRIDVGLAGLGDGEIRVLVDWTRDDVDAEGRVTSTTTHETAVFRPTGGRALPLHPLDLVEEVGEGCPKRRLVIGLKAEVREEPALAAARFAYDLWLEHVDAEGTSTVRRLRAVGGQGKSVPVAFETLAFPDPQHAGASFLLDVAGLMQGRARSDGSIEVTLEVERKITGVLGNALPTGDVSNGGRKVFQVQPGEVVRMDLPDGFGGQHLFAGDGSATHATGPATPEILATQAPSAVRLDSWAAFQGHHDALVLTVIRQR